MPSGSVLIALLNVDAEMCEAILLAWRMSRCMNKSCQMILNSDATCIFLSGQGDLPDDLHCKLLRDRGHAPCVGWNRSGTLQRKAEVCERCSRRVCVQNRPASHLAATFAALTG